MKAIISASHITLLTLLVFAPKSIMARSNRSLMAPRSYQFNRPMRDPFDLVSEFFHTPFFGNTNWNSLMRQHQQHQQQQQLNPEANYEGMSLFDPRYSFSEHNGLLQLEIELPGVHIQDVNMELENNSILRIQGTRRSRTDNPSKMRTSSFDLSFALAEGLDLDKMTAQLSTGILRVEVPRKEKTTKMIAIANADEDEKVLHIQASNENQKEGLSTEQGNNAEEVEGMTITEEE